MDDIERKREQVKMAYPHSPKWHKRVNKMSSAQVLAIHKNFTAKGKIG